MMSIKRYEDLLLKNFKWHKIEKQYLKNLFNVIGVKELFQFIKYQMVEVEPITSTSKSSQKLLKKRF